MNVLRYVIIPQVNFLDSVRKNRKKSAEKARKFAELTHKQRTNAWRICFVLKSNTKGNVNAANSTISWFVGSTGTPIPIKSL